MYRNVCSVSMYVRYSAQDGSPSVQSYTYTCTQHASFMPNHFVANNARPDMTGRSINI